MKLYVCWTTVQLPRPPRGHPCHNAYAALRDAGHDPEALTPARRLTRAWYQGLSDEEPAASGNM